MKKIAAQFRISDELFTTHGGRNTRSDITEAILQRLRHRSAEFDKIIEDDGDGHFELQLHDQDHENMPQTFVDITMELDEGTIKKLETDPDLIFVKTISIIQAGKVTIKGDTVQNNIAHISFS